MKIHKPKLEPQFHMRDGLVQVVFEVRNIQGDDVICNSAEDALRYLVEQVDLLTEVFNKVGDT